MNAPRVVSLVPSLTETLHDLGAHLVGRTRFCIHPATLNVPIVGGTKQIDVPRVLALKPDLVVANREENTREMVEALLPHVRVQVTEIATLSDALDAITLLGDATGTASRAKELRNRLAEALTALPQCPPRRVAYFIWKDPWMTVGGDTFVHQMLSTVGLTNVFGAQHRYPAVTQNEVEEARPDVLLFSSEPYPFKEQHLAGWREWLPHVPCLLVDGEAFSWYGTGLLRTFPYWETLSRQMRSLDA